MVQFSPLGVEIPKCLPVPANPVLLEHIHRMEKALTRYMIRHEGKPDDFRVKLPSIVAWHPI